MTADRGALALAAAEAASVLPDLRLVVFERWDDGLAAAFHRLESSSFRRELRYDRAELEERAARPGFEGLLAFGGREPEAGAVAYEWMRPGVLYLDVLAVRLPGRGLGSKLMEAVVRGARKAGYGALRLDTETVSERGQPLVDWYRRFGFLTADPEEDDGPEGNVPMVLSLSGQPGRRE